MLSRRQFLSHSCAVGTTAVTASGALGQLALARRAAAQSAGDYRALVCVLLAGGNDSFNMLLPYDAPAHAGYAAVRSDLALPRNSLLPLAQTDAEGRRLAVHPGMPELRDLVDSGDAVFAANIGTLLEPFSAGGARPLGLFSHLDQINQWQTAIMDDRSARGWGGRLIDAMAANGGLVQPANGISLGISLSGSNLFQSGSTTEAYTINALGNGTEGLQDYREPTPFGEFRTSVVDQLLAAEGTHPLRREYRRRLRGALDSGIAFDAAMQDAVSLSTPFASDPFSQAMRQIARVISVRQALGATRQTFFVTVGGWDHHDEVLNNQAAMLPPISQGLGAFRDAMIELGVHDAVTTFTMSDFGRTLTSNGRGSDHGWGGHQIVMGGSVNAGPIIGRYPDIAANSPLDLGRGIYVPTTAVDPFFAELALWFGVPASALSDVLPNVGRFYDPSSGAPPLGFLSGAV